MDVKSTPGHAMYETLARVYDLSGQARFSLRMVAYLLEILALRRLKPYRVIDLACGTGAAAVALARRGFAVAGLDGSPAMLARAAARAARWQVDVAWHEAPLADLPALGPFDLATCFYDSLNHLIDPEDLRRAFFGVRRLLAPGGLFFLDANTPHALARVWGASEDSHLATDYARFWKAAYDEPSGLATLEATYFVREAGATFQRLDVTHRARGYTPATVRALLEEAGFEPLAAYDCLSFEPATDQTYRVAYLARA